MKTEEQIREVFNGIPNLRTKSNDTFLIAFQNALYGILAWVLDFKDTDIDDKNPLPEETINELMRTIKEYGEELCTYNKSKT